MDHAGHLEQRQGVHILLAHISEPCFQQLSLAGVLPHIGIVHAISELSSAGVLRQQEHNLRTNEQSVNTGACDSNYAELTQSTAQ